MLKRYYREELNFLKHQGREFAEANPGLGRFLSERSSDPDVERLLEGFAFLTGRVREKVEDEFPELTHSLISILWPNYLRPVPSMTVVQFEADQSALSEPHQINRGAELASIPVEGTACLFRTCHNVTLYPLVHRGVSVHHTNKASTVELAIEAYSDLPLSLLGLDDLRLYLGGDSYSARTLYLWISHYLVHIELEVAGKVQTLPANALHAVGFESDEAVLPYPRNVHQGYRILQEYLCFPEAFHFFDIKGIAQALPSMAEGVLILRFVFSRPLPLDVRIRDEHLALNCTPAINLFEHYADPIDLTGERSEYLIRPSSITPSHFETFSVDEVSGRLDIGSQDGSKTSQRHYVPFESFQHQVESDRGRETLHYRVRVRDSLRGDGFDHSIAFMRGDEHKYLGQRETLSLDLTCSNRALPEQLTVGDVCVVTEKSPGFATFRNITQPTPVLRPNIDDELLWTLISNLSLNYLSLLDRDALCAVLKAYDFRALVDRQAERIAHQRLAGIVSIETQPVDRLCKGLPVRGIRSVVTLDQEAFGDEGSLYMFGSVLARFLSLYASINSFHELHVINRFNKERYVWGMETGQQPLM